MCMEDVRIGRKTLSRSATVPVGTGVGVLVPANKDRYTLIISAPETNPLWLTWEPAAAAGTGIRIAAGSPPVMLSIQEHGALVRGPIYASIPLGAETITFAESILEQQ